MRILIQRVKSAGVTIDEKEVSSIGEGLLLFVGIGKGDSEEDIRYLSKKVANLRIFEDEQGKMNLNVQQINGQILSVSQFTLYADTNKGNRPGFDQSADPETAKNYCERFNESLRECGLDVREGIFGAHMNIDLVNNGPVTIWLDSGKTVRSKQ
jgi:D-tyrosyl-tRNA(Tyr) deacylase